MLSSFSRDFEYIYKEYNPLSTFIKLKYDVEKLKNPYFADFLRVKLASYLYIV